jgi:hypothetical protein
MKLAKEVDTMVMLPVLSLTGALPVTPPAPTSAALLMLLLAALLGVALLLLADAPHLRRCGAAR